MDRIRKNFGFGFMRLPKKDGEVDTGTLGCMVDLFLERGFNYFDTAHGYVEGKSEEALRTCLTSRYPRDRYVLADKLSGGHFKTEADIRPLFESQLAACGVEYFDFYLMHAQSAQNFEHYKSCRAYETALELKSEGKIRHLGISFHDKAAVLDRILTEYPQIEAVQIQLNYVDWDDPAVESGKCLEVCRKHGKPAIVMEPCKGGSLVDLPEDAKAALGGLDPAECAIRFAAGQEGVMMVLSGMSDLEQVEENTGFMRDFRPLDGEETAAVDRVRDLFRSKGLISCTACRYCTDGCPQKISIPDLFACLNAKRAFQNWNSDYYYHNVHTVRSGKASDCVKCGRCEEVCPQHLPIRDLLEQVAEAFEKK